MPKLPDLNKLAEKLEFEKIVNNVKSVISPGSVIPKDAEGDPVAAKFIELHQLAEKVAKTQAEQTKQISIINNIIGALYKKLQEDGVITVTKEEKPKAPETKPKEPPKPEKKEPKD